VGAVEPKAKEGEEAGGGAPKAGAVPNRLGVVEDGGAVEEELTPNPAVGPVDAVGIANRLGFGRPEPEGTEEAAVGKAEDEAEEPNVGVENAKAGGPPDVDDDWPKEEGAPALLPNKEAKFGAVVDCPKAEPKGLAVADGWPGKLAGADVACPKELVGAEVVCPAEANGLDDASWPNGAETDWPNGGFTWPNDGFACPNDGFACSNDGFACPKDGAVEVVGPNDGLLADWPNDGVEPKDGVGKDGVDVAWLVVPKLVEPKVGVAVVDVAPNAGAGAVLPKAEVAPNAGLPPNPMEVVDPKAGAVAPNEDDGPV
jgi:hypothetical protein